MRKILKNNKGVTLLEGLIALMLLAVVATGTFGVLLSTSRKTAQPDIREEMALAVDRAAQMLQVYTVPDSASAAITGSTLYQHGLCGYQDETDPVATGNPHYINCLLPPMCDTSNGSSFSYTVVGANTDVRNKLKNSDKDSLQLGTTAKLSYSVTFNITCNGFTL